MTTIRSKIIVNVIIMLLAIIGIVIVEYRSISHLGKLQDEGVRRAEDAILAANASRDGFALYAVIADAVINCDLVNTVKEWAKTKDRNTNWPQPLRS